MDVQTSWSKIAHVEGTNHTKRARVGVGRRGTRQHLAWQRKQVEGRRHPGPWPPGATSSVPSRCPIMSTYLFLPRHGAPSRPMSGGGARTWKSTIVAGLQERTDGLTTMISLAEKLGRGMMRPVAAKPRPHLQH
jgi:hypothetical protein